jgi:hypothetical protein
MREERPTTAGFGRHSWLPLGAYAIGIVTIIGCGENGREFSSKSESVAQAVAPVERVAFANPGDATRGKEAPTPPALPRKIIYNAQVELMVESMAATTDALVRLVSESGGYISDSDRQSFSQDHQRATWKVRVPVDRFDAFLARVSRLGELQKTHLDSQDVTQEYYDLEARIANKQEEEKRLLKHLADSTGKLEEILAVERELSRVRGEIEQMQGRIRYLANLTALSTVTVTATELKDYTPPVSPTFGTQIARSFLGSAGQLVEFGKLMVLMVAALLPWLPVALVLALPLWWAVRYRRVLLTPIARQERS